MTASLPRQPMQIGWWCPMGSLSNNGVDRLSDLRNKSYLPAVWTMPKKTWKTPEPIRKLQETLEEAIQREISSRCTAGGSPWFNGRKRSITDTVHNKTYGISSFLWLLFFVQVVLNYSFRCEVPEEHTADSRWGGLQCILAGRQQISQAKNGRHRQICNAWRLKLYTVLFPSP